MSSPKSILHMKMNAPLCNLVENGAPTFLPIEVPRPILHSASADSIPHWESLTLSPLGVFYLRSWLGTHPNVPRLFTTHTKRFLASDLAWFASGAHADDQHSHSKELFHPSLKPFFANTSRYNGGKEERNHLYDNLQSLLFDMVCCCFLSESSGCLTN